MTKIYTKGGDKGQTSLIGGKRVPKNHPRVEAYGTVDELISHLGAVRASNIDVYYRNFILVIQNKLMDCAALLAADEDTVKKLPEVTPDDITALETEIDKMSALLPALHAFVIPGGSLPSAFCHVARSVCRRAERNAVTLSADYAVPGLVIKYMNRLSDFLFTLARKIEMDSDISENFWKPEVNPQV